MPFICPYYSLWLLSASFDQLILKVRYPSSGILSSAQFNYNFLTGPLLMQTLVQNRFAPSIRLTLKARPSRRLFDVRILYDCILCHEGVCPLRHRCIRRHLSSVIWQRKRLTRSMTCSVVWKGSKLKKLPGSGIWGEYILLAAADKSTV